MRQTPDRRSQGRHSSSYPECRATRFLHVRRAQTRPRAPRPPRPAWQCRSRWRELMTSASCRLAHRNAAARYRDTLVHSQALPARYARGQWARDVRAGRPSSRGGGLLEPGCCFAARRRAGPHGGRRSRASRQWRAPRGPRCSLRCSASVWLFGRRRYRVVALGRCGRCCALIMWRGRHLSCCRPRSCEDSPLISRASGQPRNECRAQVPRQRALSAPAEIAGGSDRVMRRQHRCADSARAPETSHVPSRGRAREHARRRALSTPTPRGGSMTESSETPACPTEWQPLVSRRQWAILAHEFRDAHEVLSDLRIVLAELSPGARRVLLVNLMRALASGLSPGRAVWISLARTGHELKLCSAVALGRLHTLNLPGGTVMPIRPEE